MRVHARRSAYLALTGAVAAWGLAIPSYGAVNEPKSCKTGVVRDYEHPLRTLPPNRIPARGALSFGPVDISLSSLSGLSAGRTVLQGDRIGYGLDTTRSTSSSGHLKKPIRLHWDVRMQLSRVDGAGRPMRAVARKRQRAGVVRYPDHPEFFLRSQPGVYRFDMAIRKWNGRLLKSYRQYVRVLPRRLERRIALSGRAFQPGQVVIGQIQNLGTLPLLLVSHLRLEQFSGNEWVSAEPDDTPVEWANAILLAGRAAACRQFIIPATEAYAQFRLSVDVEPMVGGRPRRTMLSAVFSMVTTN